MTFQNLSGSKNKKIQSTFLALAVTLWLR